MKARRPGEVNAAETCYSARQDDASALTEADALEARAFTITAQDHLIAILQKAPLFAARQLNRFSPARGQFDQTALTFFRCARHGAASQQIAGAQVAAVARVVREHLRERPVKVSCVAPAQMMRRETLCAHPRGEE